jgi:hypothetical protein
MQSCGRFCELTFHLADRGVGNLQWTSQELLSNSLGLRIAADCGVSKLPWICSLNSERTLRFNLSLNMTEIALEEPALVEYQQKFSNTARQLVALGS